MHILIIDCTPREKDIISAELWEHGTHGIVEEDVPGGTSHLKAFFDQRVPGLAERFHGEWQEAEHRDWVELSRSHLKPVTVGERFYITPPWSSEPTPPGRFRITMDPGQAFGTGWHETTQLMIEGIEICIVPGSSVVDVGTGTGILCEAACRLGAGRAIGCDIDPVAVRVAAERLAPFRASVFVGSLRSVRNASADVILMNINAENILQLTEEVKRTLAPSGRAVFSGFPGDRAERVARGLAAVGLTVTRKLDKGEWAALVL